MRRQRGAVVDVVHAQQLGRLPLVDLDDDFLGQVQPGLVVAHGRRWHQRAVFQNGRYFHHRRVDLVVEAKPDMLRHVRQMDVQVIQLAGIDLLACIGVALEWHPHRQPIHLCQRAVQFRRGRRTREQLDAKGFAACMRLREVRGQCLRHRLRIAGAGKAAHRHGFAGLDQGCGLRGIHAACVE